MFIDAKSNEAPCFIQVSPVTASWVYETSSKPSATNVAIAMSLAPPIFDGWNPTHKNGDEWGMVYGIAIPTLGSLGLQLQLSIEPWSMGEVTPQPLGCGGPWAPRTVVFSAQSTKFTGETWCACK